jgi:hypothetical protein
MSANGLMLRSQQTKKTKMKKSTKTESPAAPQVKKSAPSVKKSAVGTKPAAKKAVVAPTPKSAVSKKAAAPKKTATPKPAPKKTVVEKVVKKVTAVKKAVAKKLPVSKTVITAKVNVGFGNTLHLRGEGPGLSWDVGAPMNCAADDEWTISLSGAKAPVVAKFLVNDISWSTGEDFVVEPGTSVVFEPSF